MNDLSPITTEQLVAELEHRRKDLGENLPVIAKADAVNILLGATPPDGDGALVWINDRCDQIRSF